MSENPSDRVEAVEQVSTRSRAIGGTIAILAVAGIVTAFVSMCLWPAVVGIREKDLTLQCSNHLKHIAIALLNYEDEHGSLPPAYTVDENGQPLHSWRTLILPHLDLSEARELYAKIDLSKPWDDPANREAREVSLAVYRCPRLKTPENQTTYLAVATPTSAIRPGRSLASWEIVDDHFGTLLVIDVADEHAVHWMSPRDASEDVVLHFAGDRDPHPGGTEAVTAGGSIRFVSASAPPAKLRAMITAAGREELAPP